MAGPWEQYQQTAEPSGPWTQYAAAPSVEPPMRGSASGGLIETGLGAITGLGASALGGLAGLAGTLIPGERGQGARVSRYIQEGLTYQPRTQQGQSMTAALALPFELATEGAGRIGEAIGGPAAGRTIGEAVPAVASTLLPAPKMLAAAKARGAQTAARQLETNIAQSYENAPRIEAAQTANQLGISLNPAASNPTMPNKLKSVLLGDRDVNAAIAKANAPKWQELAKSDMDLSATADLRSAKTFNDARDVASKPYEPVRKITALAPDAEGNVLGEINALRVPELIGGESAAKAVNTLIDDAVAKINSGLNGDLAVKNIRQLRQDAQSVYKAEQKGTPITPEQRAAADARMGIANGLESLIESNLSGDALRAFREARVKNAQIFNWERATDPLTGKIDPAEIAKMARDGVKLSGKLADVAKIAGNFPEIAETNAVGAPAWRRHLTRSGPAGTIGYGVGTLMGAPIAGAVIGAGVGELASMLGAKRIAQPGYQAAHAVPTDYRPRQPVNNLPVPFDPRNAFVDPNTPDWNWGTGGVGAIPQDLRVGVSPTPQLPPPSLGANVAAVGIKRQYESARDRAAGALAEQRAAEAEAAQRVPTGTGQVYDIDPITGRLKSASEGLKGATPDTITSTGHTLASAVEKLSGQPTLTTATKYIRVDTGKVDAQGAPVYRVQKQSTKVTPGEQANQAFALSAEERIAWNKTKIDLASVAPEFNKLSDKVIAERMMDRQWVSNAVIKAREQARGFDEIAKRAEGAAAVRKATIERDRLMDLADSLDEQLSTMPLTKPKMQGPKTRAAQRNALRGGNDENQNALNK